MGIKDQLTAAQFKVLCSAPFAAGMADAGGCRRGILGIGMADVAAGPGGCLGIGTKPVADEQAQAAPDGISALPGMSS
jgi:hypothetical protein